MSSDSNASSPTIEADAGGTQSPASRWKPSGTTLKYGLVVVILTSQYAFAFFQYLSPDLSDWLLTIFFLSLPVMFFLLVRSLFRRRWKEFAIFLAAGVVALLPFLGVREPIWWMAAQGFHIHASPIEEYLSRCKLIEFVEKGTKQTVGECESNDGGSYGAYFDTVIYDTTGELLLPVSHRTQDWQRAMSEFYSEDVLNSSGRRTHRIFGNFYNVGTSLAEERGDDRWPIAPADSGK